MTILELLKVSTEHLKSKGFDNPKTSCEILLSHALGMKRLDLYLNFDKPVSDQEREQFREMYRRRLEHEPLQYITGETEFMSLPFMVNKHVLIPRPETELVVEETVKRMKESWGETPVEALDIGTGCGNIAVSLAHYLPGSRIFGIDINPEAVETAKQNAETNNLSDRTEFSVIDIMGCDPESYNSLNLIISNPPYVLESDRPTLTKQVIDFEPHEALFAGEDGLIFYETISGLAASWLCTDGILVFETGYNIGPQIQEIVENEGFSDVELMKDYAGHDRIIFGRKTE